MVGNSMTSAPSFLSPSANPDDCSLARVIRILFSVKGKLVMGLSSRLFLIPVFDRNGRGSSPVDLVEDLFGPFAQQIFGEGEAEGLRVLR